jgi:hypothetical protein
MELGEIIMPKPRKGESKKDYISRCIPIVMDEGTAKDNKQAAAICYSFWDRKDEITDTIIDRVLNEAKDEYCVMFFDPALFAGIKTRKNTLVVGKVVNDKLQIVEGDVWVGAEFEDVVMPDLVDSVKKWKPQVVFCEDNIFQAILKKIMEDYHIPFKGVTRISSKEAVEMAAENPAIEWKAQKHNNLYFGAGSLLLILKKMKRLMGEATTYDSDDTPAMELLPATRRKVKFCKKSKKFKEALEKD